MILAKIKVSGVAVTARILSRIPRGIIGATIELEFSGPEWDGLTKIVVFRGSATRDVLDVGTTVRVPAECVEKVGDRLLVGIYGTSADDAIAIPTIWCSLGPVVDATDPSGDPSMDPALPGWAQLEAKIGNLSKLETAHKGNLVEAINEAAASGGGGGSILATDDGEGNVEIMLSGGLTVTDDGAGNVTIM